MQSAEQQARQHDYRKIALNVAEGNKPAVDLYTHLHYVVTQRTLLYQYPHVRMVKAVES
jgi:ribosomal protein S18 acetylase RimI-like enzyme